ncbi:uncharacterized protein LOC135388113 [Ornithodoros turicata]|uniref:uncharacterized protein LOC135388113 n=1 Tax=Ornithodoros turicata TaxID=34597 RepID=UPI0031389C69
MEYKPCVLPWPYLRPFFECVREYENNLQVQCKLCLPAEKYLSVGKGSNSNLRKHVKSMHPARVREMDRHHYISPTRERGMVSEVLYRTNTAFRVYPVRPNECIASTETDISSPSTSTDTTSSLHLSEVRSLAVPFAPQTSLEPSIQIKKEITDVSVEQESLPQRSPTPSSTTRATIASHASSPFVSYSEPVTSSPVVPPEPVYSRHFPTSEPPGIPLLVRPEPHPVTATSLLQQPEPSTTGAFFGPRKRSASPRTRPSPAEQTAEIEFESRFAQRERLGAELRKLEADERKVLAETRLLNEKTRKCEEAKRKFQAEAEFFVQEKARSVEETRKAAAKAALHREQKNFYLEQQKTEVMRRRLILLEIRKAKRELQLDR